ncbi:MAG: hypothetical protein AABY22_01230, partial [Nanoarchaeota archaeon]
LPLPKNMFGIASWHTLAFVFGEWVNKFILKSCLSEHEKFYYLIHPADLMSEDDLDGQNPIMQPRKMTLGNKIRVLEESIETILEDGRKMVTMEELALLCRESINDE